MHESVMKWVNGRLTPEMRKGRVIEVGALNVNGTVRALFAPACYVGVDMVAGRGVDVQALGAWLPFAGGAFDVAVCTEVLEHDLTFWFTVEELRRVLRPGGRLLLTCRGYGFPYHGYPHDYYRFTPNAVALVLQLYGFHVLACGADPQYPGVLSDAVRVA